MISSRNKLTHFWHPKFESKFLNITSEFSEKIRIITAAHNHRSEVRNIVLPDEKPLGIPIITTQSISPVFGNNPGYTILNFNGEDTETTVHTF